MTVAQAAILYSTRCYQAYGPVLGVCVVDKTIRTTMMVVMQDPLPTTDNQVDWIKTLINTNSAMIKSLEDRHV